MATPSPSGARTACPAPVVVAVPPVVEVVDAPLSPLPEQAARVKPIPMESRRTRRRRCLMPGSLLVSVR